MVYYFESQANILGVVNDLLVDLFLPFGNNFMLIALMVILVFHIDWKCFRKWPICKDSDVSEWCPIIVWNIFLLMKTTEETIVY